MLNELFNSKFKNIILIYLSFVFNRDVNRTERKIKKLLDSKKSDKKIFRSLHKYYLKKIQNTKYNNYNFAELRANKKAKELKDIIKNINYNKNKYVDIGCEECSFPLYFGNLFNITNVSCINIDNWESKYTVTKPNMTDCNFKIYDGFNLPYENNSISVISIYMVLHHIHPKIRKKLIDSIYDKLEKNGIVIIREHNHDYTDIYKKFLDFVHRIYDSIKLEKFLWIDDYNTFYMSVKKLDSEFNRFKKIEIKEYDRPEKPFIAIYKKI